MSEFDKIIGYSAVKKELKQIAGGRKDGDFVKVIKATFEKAIRPLCSLFRKSRVRLCLLLYNQQRTICKIP